MRQTRRAPLPRGSRSRSGSETSRIKAATGLGTAAVGQRRRSRRHWSPRAM
jgi:hypothetical protein